MGSPIITFTTTDFPTLFASTSEFYPGSSDGHWEGDVTNAAWKDIELPEDDSAWKETVEGKPFDLSVLWQILEKQKEHMDEKEVAGKHINTTWELVVVQVQFIIPMHLDPANHYQVASQNLHQILQMI